MLTLHVERTVDRRNIEQRLDEAEAQVQALRRRVNELLADHARRDVEHLKVVMAYSDVVAAQDRWIVRLQRRILEEGVHVGD